MLKSLLLADPVSVYNDGDSTIPGYGIVEFSSTGAFYIEGKSVFAVQRPGTTYKRIYLVNGPTPIASGRYGVCYFGCNTPVWALWDNGESEDEPEVGKVYGPTTESYTLQNNFYGFNVVGGFETEPYYRVLVTQHFPDSLTVKLGADETLSRLKGCDAKVQKVIGDPALPEDDVTFEDSGFDLVIFDIGYLMVGKELIEEAQCEVGVRGNLWAVFQSECPTEVPEE